ncbi:hypothetical protein L861_16915 [Litchfieldella anticariensis FP35 = DSM 16096]|uniref:DUF427 domain-containing protein n=1 Tax=Litchfieldella anticariensis (strain DSM 16096 / CECT 5854 / CIP 108499 / LMG 22089 / FP35) TaxID=1121939 RepID=S2KM59_LITA3|nr:DUF427 domain-containing protein [Halomonas anticariensis]EPC01553.1 hypothetical protein L861_16915 [Halomonas anticariensis FP35 = DSM 16096]
MIHDPTGRISLHPNPQRVRVWIGETLLADTRDAIELREKDYPPRQYIPRQDVDMQHLVQSATVTHCPFKGDASYYSLSLDGETLTDVAWSYEQPFDAMTDIAEHLAFDAPLVRHSFDD